MSLQVCRRHRQRSVQARYGSFLQAVVLTCYGLHQVTDQSLLGVCTAIGLGAVVCRSGPALQTVAEDCGCAQLADTDGVRVVL